MEAGISDRNRNILLAIAATILPLLLLEASMRLVSIEPERYHPTKRLVPEGDTFVDRGWGGGGKVKRIGIPEVQMGEYIPNATYKYQFATNPRGYFEQGNTIPVYINNLGLRGPDTTIEKPKNTYRILGLGDSFTLGAGVYDRHTFLRRLEARLNNSSASSQKYEVLNSGVEGYNTKDEVIYFERKWLQLKPDAVIITFYLNDAYSDQAILNKGQELGIYLRPSGLAKVSYLFDYLQHHLRLRQIHDNTVKYYKSRFFSVPERGIGPEDSDKFDWNHCKIAFQRLKQLTDAHEMKLLLVIFPELIGLDEEHYLFQKVHEMVADFADSQGIAVLDLLPAFRGRKASELWVHPSDHHPNEKAHKIAADAIFERVQPIFHNGSPKPN